MPKDGGITVLIVAGEASGDVHGARLVLALKDLDPGIRFAGLGGKRMKEAGVRLLAGDADLAVVGLTEAFAKLKAIARAMRAIKASLRNDPPDLLILIDYPDFNLKIARTARKLRVKVFYYISPQIWAWRGGRIRKIKRYVDRMAVILPFEEDLYRRAGVDVSFVGHPLLDGVAANQTKEEARAALGLKNGITTISLLPGSRASEVRRHLPVMLEAGRMIEKEHGPVQFVLPVADSIDRGPVEKEAKGARITVAVVKGQVQEALLSADLVIVASGTATLETALLMRPMIIIYRLSRFSYLIGRMFIKVRHIGLVNIIAGKTVVPELIQDQASPAAIAGSAVAILRDHEGQRRLVEQLALVRESLGEPGAAARTARLAYDLIKGK